MFCLGKKHGQGATEYLVLLAVVLIIALVSIALLGFFPGMATDAQQAESKLYWQSAAPIAISEWNARYAMDSNIYYFTAPYFRLKNTGTYPITITKMYFGNQTQTLMSTGWWGPLVAMNIPLQPGEEANFACPLYYPGMPDPGSGSRKFTLFGQDNATVLAGYMVGIGGAKAYCRNTPPYGTFILENVSFEYTATVEGQSIAKRQQSSKPIVIPCMNNYN